MSKSNVNIHEGIIIDEENKISLFQLCHFCNLEPENVIELVEEGILAPYGRSKQEWRFTFTTIERVKKVQRLRRDLDLNISGAALAIHLLDRIERLEMLLERMED